MSHLKPVPKGADDALQAGMPLREQTPEEVEATLQHCADISPADPEKRPPVPIAESLPGWPYAENILAPAGYEYRRDGIGQLLHPPKLDNAGNPVKDDKKKIVLDRSKPPVWTLKRRQHIALVARARDIHTGHEVLTVAWFRDGKWHDQGIPRENLRDSRRIVKTLAALGIDVTSDTASDLVEWLASCESVNLDTIPVTQVSSAMGWQDEELTTFLLGDLQIGGPTPIRYRGSDTGGEALAEGFRPKGTLEGWLAAVEPIREHDPVLMAFYVALAPPLLAILDAPSFVLDLSGPTSRGKTSTLQVAGSIWGQPDPSRDPSVVGTWDATPVHIERTAAALGSLPVLLDDTARARQREDPPRVVYTVTQGVGRGRGSVGGTARSARWRTVALSTGETPLRSYGTAGGRTARCMTLWGPPWGSGTGVGARVRSVVRGVHAHYGHAGRVVVEWLQRQRECWPGLREQYRLARDRFLGLSQSPEAQRQAEYVGVVAVAMSVAHLALDLPWPEPHAMLDRMWPGLAEEVEDAHGAVSALRAVYSWACAQQDSFWSLYGSATADGEPVKRNQPSGGWLGRWDRDSSDTWSELAIVPHQLRRHLVELGFDYEATLRCWLDNGWMAASIGHRTSLIRLDGVRARVFCIRRESFEENHILQ